MRPRRHGGAGRQHRDGHHHLGGVLGARHRLGGGRARDDPVPAGGALRGAARRRDALAGRPVPDGRRAVPGGRADHRLHRRGADALPVRDHDRRGELGRLPARDHPRPAALGRPGRHRAAGAADPGRRARGDRAGGPRLSQLRGGQREQDRDPDLHPVLLPVRSHQRAAHHRGAGRHGAGAPGADQPEADPARPVPAAGGGRAPDAAAGAGDLRPPQRGGLPGAAARRHPGGAVGQPGHLRAPRRAGGGQRGAPGGGRRAARQPGGHGPARPAGSARRPGPAEGPNGNGQEGARS